MNIRQSKIDQGLPLEASDFYKDNYIAFHLKVGSGEVSMIAHNYGECFKEYFPVKIGGNVKLNMRWYKITRLRSNSPEGTEYEIVRYPWYKRIFGL